MTMKHAMLRAVDSWPARLAGVFLVLLLSARLMAATTTTEGWFDEVYGDGYYDSFGDPSGNGVYFNDVPVNDLAQFDPTLGYLTDVTIDVDYEYEYSLVLFSGEKTDPFAEFEASIDLPDVNFFIGYSPGNSATTFALANTAPFPFVSLYGLDVDDYLQEEDYLYDSGSAVGESLWTLSGFVLDDFVGYDLVDALSAVITVPVGADFTLVNLDDANAEFYGYLYSSTVTLTYTYDEILPGDANSDGVVDIQDFVILKQNYGSVDAGWAMGDFTGDGAVNIEDFVVLKQNYGAGGPP